MSPGPSLAVVIRNCITYNRLAGILTSIGHGLGMLIYATIVVIGLGIIIQSYETLFFIIQIIGCLFLIGLGLIFILSSREDININNSKMHSNSFNQGFLIAIFNPKILIWFTAIYSHFIRIDADNFEKTILISTAAIIDILWYSLVSLLVTSFALKDFFDDKKSIIQKIMGSILIIISFVLLYKLFFL